MGDTCTKQNHYKRNKLRLKRKLCYNRASVFTNVIDMTLLGVFVNVNPILVHLWLVLSFHPFDEHKMPSKASAMKLNVKSTANVSIIYYSTYDDRCT